jgi:hypothetical protein
MKGPSIENGYLSMTGVSCPSPTSCVAVGVSRAPGTVAFVRPVIEHWNGSRWAQTSGATPPDPNAVWGLNDVSCPSTDSCFAVGETGLAAYYDPTDTRTSIQHWDGSAWSIVESPTPDGGEAWLNGVACASTTNCNAVGTFDDSGTPTLVSLAVAYE